MFLPPQANASAADRARDSDLDPETPEEARTKRAAFEKMVREVHPHDLGVFISQ